MPSKEKMIDWLVSSDLIDWYDDAEQFAYLASIMKSGFKGYENYSYDEIKSECEDRDMWDILIEQDEQLDKEFFKRITKNLIGEKNA